MESTSVAHKKEQSIEEIAIEDEEENISCRPSIDISVNSLDYSDAEDQPWHSPLNSNAGSYYDYDYSSDFDPATPEDSNKQATRISDVNGSEADLEKGLAEPKFAEPDAKTNQGSEMMESVGKREKDCRICHLSLETNPEAGASIVLGCSCKDDLAAAHKHCAETWFKIRGNRTCEICGSTARNVVCIEDSNFMDQWNEGSAASTVTTETRNFWRGHKFLNFLLACMVFAFVISWLFHFNVPS
eukprot:TRINITY_DN6843_c0_g3_i1.p1 TRINITY_DN6843_c0_g3~~TRINITY_DN6843_c0_g3_i1.p1  ORF type:complete len:243 (+),score=48.34 TRINITY_DN6843_c0_g3_i1:472-1200(+)